jgi:class 3 adenylate cyclase
MMRLSRELTPDFFDALLSGHHRLLRRLFEEMGGREVEVSGDSALPAFPTAKAGRACGGCRPSQPTNGRTD